MSALFSNGPVRLNRFLARCGIDSRRQADAIILQGRVSINGSPVTSPGISVQESDSVRVDGKIMMPKDTSVLILNKPKGFVCSREAQSGSQHTIYELLLPRFHHLHYIGRLDNDSEGLLLLTNDGDIDNQLMRPEQGIEKEYWVTLDQAFDNGVLDQLVRGVTTKEGHAKAKSASRLSARRACLVLEQGIKRQIREMFSCLGLRVTKLVRVRIGSLWLGDLQPGTSAILSDEEIALAFKNPQPAQAHSPESRPAKFKPSRESSAPSRPKPAQRKESFFAKGQAPSYPERFSKSPESFDEPREASHAPDQDSDRQPRKSWSRDSGFSDRKVSRDRPQRFNDDRPRRFDNDRPRRDDDSARPRRFDGDRPRNFDNDRPRRFDSDRPRNFDGPGRPQRSWNGDRPRRDDDSPRPRFNQDGDRPRNFDNDRPRRFNDERPRRFNDAGPRRFDNDRPRRDWDSDRPRQDRGDRGDHGNRERRQSFGDRQNRGDGAPSGRSFSKPSSGGFRKNSFGGGNSDQRSGGFKPRRRAW